MAKQVKQQAKQEEETLAVKGTFEELVKLSVTGLEKPAVKPAPKKAEAKKVAKKKN